MKLILIYALCAAAGYFLGCQNLAHRLAQRRGFDIRTVGSNNPGASNTVIAIAMGYPAGWFVASASTFIYYKLAKFGRKRIVS